MVGTTEIDRKESRNEEFEWLNLTLIPNPVQEQSCVQRGNCKAGVSTKSLWPAREATLVTVSPLVSSCISVENSPVVLVDTVVFRGHPSNKHPAVRRATSSK